MQPAAPEISTCPGCGRALEETSAGGLGCMLCLVRVGIGSEDEPAEDSTSRGLEGGERFGVYEIERHPDGSLYELGHGAMGATYRAIDTALQREVALKIIQIAVAGRSAEARERFLREARAAAALRHENIATVFQFGIREETGQCFYAMELIEGETLDERVRRTGPLDVRTAIDIAQQVTSALMAAERRGLIHRDLKPANLMLVSPDDATADAFTQRGDYNNRRGVVATASGDQKNEKLSVKIIDFGLAKALNAPSDPTRLTHDGFVGTPAFASPEQFDNSILDVRSDIYSLGVTLWFALTGKTPFAGHGVEEIHRAQQSSALPIELLKAAHVPHRLRSLIESMLSPEPASRPGTHDLAAELQRCAVWESGARRTRVAVAAAAAAILILAVSAFFVFPSLHTHPTTSGSTSNPALPEKSIAVLPFDNLSRDPDNAFFTDGVQDQILTNLAQIADLKVISRTSVMQYKSGAPRNLREIGQQLGVGRVVEGSVQRAGNRVRVNAQLIDARNHAHLWAQTYDRDLADVFAIQSEIAKAIADQLQATLSPNEKKAIEQPPTSDVAAFDLYTRAKTLLLTTSFTPTGEQNLRQAVELLNQAATRDPAFFEAYYQLAFAHGRLYSLGLDHTASRLASAEAALQGAIRLRPDAGETHLARANYLYYGPRDYAGALAELEYARRSLPNDPRLFELTGYILRRRGQQEEGLRNLQKAIELDPRNYFIMQQIALSYQFLRRYPEEAAILDRALTIIPKDAATKVNRALVDFYWKADTKPLHQVIDSILAGDPSAISEVADSWFVCALAEHDHVAAERALVALGDNPWLVDAAVILSRSFGQGLLARVMKDEAKARAAFSKARAEREKIVQAQPDYGPALCVLGLIDAALGRKEAALEEARRATELLPLEKDSVNGSRMLVYFAITAAWTGEKDLALQQLELGARAPNPSQALNYGALKLLPFWDPLRGDPRFEKIVASAAPEPVQKSAPDKSIAVLPFENLSRDPDNAFFADGVQDDILTKLAKVADLKVISRTSVMQYRDKHDLRQIGAALGVSHILEGTVRRSDGKVHINAQLIDARTDTHVWAEEYDRNLNDVFAIESDVAQSVASRLTAKVSARETLAMQERPTSDLVAYDLYTRAKNLVLAAAGRSTGRTDLVQAIDLLNQATARDPSFLQAYCQLASAHGHLYSLGLDRTSARLELANAAIQAAYGLRPEAGEVHLARAENLYRGYLDYNGALAELKVARHSLPNDPRILQLTAFILRRQGHWNEATQDLERALELDPRSTYTLQQMAWQYMFLRRYAEVKPLLTRVLAIEPKRPDIEVFLASVDFHWKADIKPFHQMVDSTQTTNPSAVSSVAEAWLTCALAERDQSAVANAMAASGEDVFGDDTVQFSRKFIEGVVARMMNNESKAQAAFTAARLEQAKAVGAGPDAAGALCVLGLIDAALGQKEEALREGRRAVELVPLEKDAIVGTRMLAYSAMIAAWAGDKDLACEQLASAIRHPTSPSYGDLKLLPWWDPLRGDSRFEKIVASLAPK
jgi:TolB-like protein/Flp pilus assembly protein TadD